MLERREFLILREIAEKGKQTQRRLSAALRLSIGTVNRTVRILEEKGCLSDGRLTEVGASALEPYRVERAVFLAAGFGSRLVPATLNTPKPLVRIHGKRMIDTMLDAVIAAGIREIYIVRGYLGIQFDQLLADYPMIKFLENPLYNQSNNISSLLAAGEHVKNAYILEADFYVRDPSVIRTYQYASNYLGCYCARTDDWMITEDRGYASGMSLGGENGWRSCGVSYWTTEDGARLFAQAKELWDRPGGHERFFDHIPMEDYKNDYHLEIRPCDPEALVEIDTYAELCALDPAYSVGNLKIP